MDREQHLDLIPEDNHDHSSSANSDEYTSTGLTAFESSQFSERRESLQQKRDKTVWRNVLVSLLLLNGALAGVTYLWILISRDQVVQNQFYDFADKIASKSLEQARHVEGELNVITEHVNSVAVYKKANWPFHTHEHFGLLNDDLLNETGIQLVAIVPLVGNDARYKWEMYSIGNQEWVLERGQLWSGDNQTDGFSVNPQIFRRHPDGEHVVEYEPGPYAPLWQFCRNQAPIHALDVNFNLLSVPSFSRALHEVLETERSVLSETMEMADLFGISAPADNVHPQSLIIQPIFNDYSSGASVTGAIVGVVSWHSIFENMLWEGADGVVVVMKDTCGTAFTYQINGGEAVFLGDGDHHNDDFDYMLQQFDFDVGNTTVTNTTCQRTLYIYPSGRYYQVYIIKKTPATFAGYLVLIFFFTCAVFKIHECITQVRERKIEKEAAKARKVVETLYPEGFQDQVLEQAETPIKMPRSDKARLDSFLDDEEDHADALTSSKPIASLFSNATVLYADIAGFTAWSSIRDPVDVFTLLESIFASFDEVAKRLNVFKVETVGDCYIAVTGLPRPQPDHAVIMARFARDCIEKMNYTMSILEQRLGPGTNELQMRVGIHSGPVTAGVLRGEKSRFQLFGDTVNIASKIESSGMRNRIHISQETAYLIIAGGKSSWIQPRAEKIVLDNRDDTQTFWLLTKSQLSSAAVSSRGCGSIASESHASSGRLDAGDEAKENEGSQPSLQRISYVKTEEVETEEYAAPSSHIERLIRWNADVLNRLLAATATSRNFKDHQKLTDDELTELENDIKRNSVLEEVEQNINIPPFNEKAWKDREDDMPVVLEPYVMQQLQEYITAIAVMHGECPFHGFDHASHVAMSLNKLLFRIAPADADYEDCKYLHNKTYGVTSDPLIHFALVFSALISDVAYNQEGVLEGNSVNPAWKLLMEDRFKALRRCIYTNEDELRCFRQVIVLSVMSTNMLDEDEIEGRKRQWEESFALEGGDDQFLSPGVFNSRATLVIQHITCASYFSHTMQHWYVYKKWSEKMLEERYLAYLSGVTKIDPSSEWLDGELSLFDNFIVPLAKNLSDCGIFGFSGDEYLKYATENRKELAMKGEDLLQSLADKFANESLE